MKSPRNETPATLIAVLAAVAVTIGLPAIGGETPNASFAPAPAASPSPVAKFPKALDPNARVYARAGKGGSNVGGANGASGNLGSITAWCRGSVGILNMARQVVGASLLNSDYATAIATYRGGIVQAIKQAEDQGIDQSLTLNALRRALSIGDALYAAMIGAEDREIRVVDFYNTTYDFLTKVADEIDLPLYIPYTRGSRKFDPLRHEAQFAKYGVEQLQWLMANFTYESSEQYYAQFNGAVYLTLAEHLTAGVAEDLGQSIFANAYACQVQDLELLSQLLARHNSGDRTVYGGREKYAVNSSAFAIKQVILKLNTGCARSAF